MIGFVFAWVIIIAIVAFALIAFASIVYIADWLMEEITGVGLFEIAENLFTLFHGKIIHPLIISLKRIVEW